MQASPDATLSEWEQLYNEYLKSELEVEEVLASDTPLARALAGQDVATTSASGGIAQQLGPGHGRPLGSNNGLNEASYYSFEQQAGPDPAAAPGHYFDPKNPVFFALPPAPQNVAAPGTLRVSQQAEQQSRQIRNEFNKFYEAAAAAPSRDWPLGPGSSAPQPRTRPPPAPSPAKMLSPGQGAGNAAFMQ